MLIAVTRTIRASIVQWQYRTTRSSTRMATRRTAVHGHGIRTPRRDSIPNGTGEGRRGRQCTSVTQMVGVAAAMRIVAVVVVVVGSRWRRW